MKKTYKYAVVGLLFMFLADCEDFLDKCEDSGGLTEEAVYSSYESIRGFLDQVYPKLEAYNTFEGADDGKNQRTYVGVMADEMSATYNKTVFAKFFSGAWLTTDKAANVTEIGNGNNTPIGKALHHFWFFTKSDFFHLVVINASCFLIQVIFARSIDDTGSVH